MRHMTFQSLFQCMNPPGDIQGHSRNPTASRDNQIFEKALSWKQRNRHCDPEQCTNHSSATDFGERHAMIRYYPAHQSSARYWFFLLRCWPDSEYALTKWYPCLRFILDFGIVCKILPYYLPPAICPGLIEAFLEHAYTPFPSYNVKP